MPAPSEMQILLTTIQDHLHRTAEFDPTYRPETTPTNEAGLLYLQLKTLLHCVKTVEEAVSGWYWRAVFHGEVVNSGFELGSVKPDLKDSVPGVVFEYTPFYSKPGTLSLAELHMDADRYRWLEAQSWFSAAMAAYGCLEQIPEDIDFARLAQNEKSE